MVGIAIRIGTVVAERAAPYILRALPPILGGTGGVIVGDQLSKELENKQEEASRAKSSPIAKADASVQSKEKCEACPPMAGVPITKNFKEHRSWMDYQLRITGMPSGPGFLTEWLYARREFDGFKPAECLLIETKAGYDQFFNDDEEFDYPFQRGIMNKMLGQVRDQNDVAVPRPPRTTPMVLYGAVFLCLYAAADLVYFTYYSSRLRTLSVRYESLFHRDIFSCANACRHAGAEATYCL